MKCMRINDPLDTTLLHTFRAVVEEGSLFGAGVRLNCVQSNVTARIKRLEERLGARLLERCRGRARQPRRLRIGRRRVPETRGWAGERRGARAQQQEVHCHFASANYSSDSNSNVAQ